jgi:hypothetical protein
MSPFLFGLIVLMATWPVGLAYWGKHRDGSDGDES